MDKQKHTPGPWKMHDMEKLVVVGGDHVAIANCNALTRSPAENEANADLIIAAPEMLEGLRLIGNARTRCEEKQRIARTILAKIEEGGGNG